MVDDDDVKMLMLLADKQWVNRLRRKEKSFFFTLFFFFVFLFLFLICDCAHRMRKKILKYNKIELCIMSKATIIHILCAILYNTD